MTRSSHIALAAFLSALMAGSGPLFAQPLHNSVSAREQALRELGIAPATQPVKCGFGQIAWALQNRQQLTSPQQAALMVLVTRPTTEKNILRGHFRVHYDTSATSSQTPALLDASHQRIPGTADAYAESVAVSANYVYDVEIGKLGYDPPPSDGTLGGGPEYDLYVQELYIEYGMVVPEIPLDTKPDGGRSGTYMVLDNDFTFVQPETNRGMPALHVTLAHEFHHAVQIGSYGYWSAETYYYEITSTWLEDVVYPGVDDYLNYLRSSESQFELPQLTFTSNSTVEYSRAIWGKYVQKKFGDRAIKRSWELIRQMKPLDAIDGSLHEVGSSLRLAFAEWSVWNYFTGQRADTVRYYTEGRRFPMIRQSSYGFTPPSRTIPGDLPSLASRYLQIISGGDVLDVTINNLNPVPASTTVLTGYPYTYVISNDRSDDAFQPIGGGIFGKLNVPDPSNWKAWSASSGRLMLAGMEEGVPFPNPFLADGHSTLNIPADAAAGELSIYSSAMDLIYSYTGPAATVIGHYVFQWNGQTNSSASARSGIYVYVLQLPDRLLKGKIALIRN